MIQLPGLWLSVAADLQHEHALSAELLLICELYWLCTDCTEKPTYIRVHWLNHIAHVFKLRHTCPEHLLATGSAACNFAALAAAQDTASKLFRAMSGNSLKEHLRGQFSTLQCPTSLTEYAYPSLRLHSKPPCCITACLITAACLAGLAGPCHRLQPVSSHGPGSCMAQLSLPVDLAPPGRSPRGPPLRVWQPVHQSTFHCQVWRPWPYARLAAGPPDTSERGSASASTMSWHICA